MLCSTQRVNRLPLLAAALTLLSYMATAVISASEAMHYVHELWLGLPVITATIILLAFFMFLTIIRMENLQGRCWYFCYAPGISDNSGFCCRFLYRTKRSRRS